MAVGLIPADAFRGRRLKYNESMNYAAVVERETPLEAMWHAYRASDFSPPNQVEADPSIRGALLNTRYYDGCRGQLLS